METHATISQLQQWREELYDLLPARQDALLDLLNALCGSPHAHAGPVAPGELYAKATITRKRGGRAVECKQERNLTHRTCELCPRKGPCCECIAYHLSHDELPGCVFPPEAKRTNNRSKRYFAQIYGRG